jgi:hypothetical protein
MAGGISANRGYEAVEFASELFERLGYKVQQESIVGGINVDLIVERDGLRSPVEVKYWRPVDRDGLSSRQRARWHPRNPVALAICA